MSQFVLGLLAFIGAASWSAAAAQTAEAARDEPQYPAPPGISWSMSVEEMATAWGNAEIVDDGYAQILEPAEDANVLGTLFLYKGLDVINNIDWHIECDTNVHDCEKSFNLLKEDITGQLGSPYEFGFVETVNQEARYAVPFGILVDEGNDGIYPMHWLSETGAEVFLKMVVDGGEYTVIVEYYTPAVFDAALDRAKDFFRNAIQAAEEAEKAEKE